MNRSLAQLGVAVAAALLSACNCGPVKTQPDAEVEVPVDAGKRDAGRIIVLPTDSGIPAQRLYAGEPCPASAFAELDDAGTDEDGGVVLGICAALTQLTSQALLNDQPVKGAVQLQFLGGNFYSEMEQTPDSFGKLETRVLRGFYDIFRYQPAGVFPGFRGFIDEGRLDMQHDQSMLLAARKHSLRGTAFFGNMPLVSHTNPGDLNFDMYGSPEHQIVSVSTNSGSYETSFLEGQFAPFLTVLPTSMYGTEFFAYQMGTSNIDFMSDSNLDIDIPTSLLEGEVTFDHHPIGDRLVGADYTLDYARAGDQDVSIRTYHEGGIASFSGLVPKGRYMVAFNLRNAPDRHYPSEMFNFQLTQQIDLNNDNHASINFNMFDIEGGITIDGMPVRPNPSYKWQMFMYGFAGATNNDSGLLYQVPMDSSAFQLKAPEGNYFTVLMLDENLDEALATGYYVVNNYLQIHSNVTLPINVETHTLTMKIVIDGQSPPEGEIIGRMFFRNRALDARFSTYWRTIRTAQDGTVRVKLPKGEYDVTFVIDRKAYPEYASGSYVAANRIILDTDRSIDVMYDTVLVHGPIRLAGQVVADTLGTEEVGLKLKSADDRMWEWGFPGGSPNYRMRIPRGEYDLNFVVNRGAVDGVAWGDAPMGLKFNTATGVSEGPPTTR